MNHLPKPHNVLRLARRIQLPNLHAPLEQVAEIHLATRSVERRAPASETTSSSSATSSTSCSSSQDSDTCQKPTNTTATLPIVLGAVIPIVCALIVLLFLHRRNRRRQRLEDANDPHKSLDYGLGTSSSKKAKGRRGLPEMVVTGAETPLRRGRGLSMDIDMGSPYILPGGLQSSRDSIHSMSRSVQDTHDPYRPVTMIKGSDPSSRYPRMKSDNSSAYTGSSIGADSMNANLLRNAQSMSKAYPQRGDSKSAIETTSMQSSQHSSTVLLPPQAHNARGASLASGSLGASQDSYLDQEARNNGQDAGYLGSSMHSQNATNERLREPNLPASLLDSAASPPLGLEAPISPPTSALVNRRPVVTGSPRLQSPEGNARGTNPGFMGHTDFSHSNSFNSPVPTQDSSRQPQQHASNVPLHPPAEGLSLESLGYDPRNLSTRPLPPDDPTENPEERANRIRSFYKEYFDDKKQPPMPAAHTPLPGEYYEDYGQEFLNEAAMVDPATGNFVIAARRPFADPVTRRAMTPPPRAPPRFLGSGSRHTSSGSSNGMPPRGHASSGSPVVHPPRGRSATQGTSRRPLPPPAALTTLPTPHMLKDDTAMFSPIDFAPPATYRQRQAGQRPASPLGERRPYSPSVRAHTPLVSSFDDLSVMPSPHALRNSKTFTGLDFAPPSRLRGDTASDAGSIRSARSGGGMSAAQAHNIRTGAYRVSRMPKDVVGTRDDLAASLKPSWNMQQRN